MVFSAVFGTVNNTEYGTGEFYMHLMFYILLSFLMHL